MITLAPYSDFELPESAPDPIRRFYKLWCAKALDGLPHSSDFDIAEMSAEYPLLARIGFGSDGRTLIWLELSSGQRWPFGAPQRNGPVADSVPPLSIKRVLGSFNEALSIGIPDYFETTSWLCNGHSMSLARLVVPLAANAGRELIALWHLIDPPRPI